MKFVLLSELNELDPLYLKCRDFVLANIPEGMSTEQFRRSIMEAGVKGDKYNFVVAVEGEKPLGFLSFAVRREKKDILYNRVYVDPINRRKKIAVKLIFALISEMKKIGIGKAIAFAPTEVAKAVIAKINENPRKGVSEGKTSWHERFDERGNIELNPEIIRKRREKRLR